MKGMTYPTIISQHLPKQSQSHHHVLCKKSSDWISYWVEYYLWMLWKLSIKLVLSSVRYLRISMLRKMSTCSSPKSNGKGFKRCSWEAPPQCFHICLLKVWSITLIKQLHEEKHYIQLSKLNHSFFHFWWYFTHTQSVFNLWGGALWASAHWLQSSIILSFWFLEFM